ncbi:hypothetical protein DV735_g607, partial [Chaetothyriales sp. CBS 134920]
MMPASTLKSTRSEQKREEQRLHTKHISRAVPRRAELSSLEKLPLEVIQQIFFLCLETNLPNASLVLSKALSHESIYRAVILFAYFDYTDGLSLEPELFLPAPFYELDYWNRCRLQGQILKTRWCTIDRIKAAMPTLSRLVMLQRLDAERLATDRARAAPPALDPVVLDVEARRGAVHYAKLPRGAIDHAELPRADDTAALKQHFFATTDVEFPLLCFMQFGRESPERDIPPAPEGQPCGHENYIPFIHFWACARYKKNRLSKFIDGAFATLAVRCIPTWLLRGPWSGPGAAERIDFLKLLRQGMRYLWYNVFSPDNDACKPPADWDAIPPHDRRDRLPLELFHLAAAAGATETELGNDSTAMRLLIRASLRSIPKDDSVLTAWAVRMRALGDPIGDWLLSHMATPDPDPWEWYNGMYFGLDNKVFPFTDFTEEIGYYTGADQHIIPTVVKWE